MPAAPNTALLDANPGAIGEVVEIALAVGAIQHIGVVGEVRLEQIEVVVEIVVQLDTVRALRSELVCAADMLIASAWDKA
jgi:hypothetical protein